MKYDFLIVGAGFAGATCARLLTDSGYKCLIIEERPFVGGNCVTNNIDGIDVHILGPHVFYTNDLSVWNFVNKYDEFIDYNHEVYTYSNGKLYSNAMNLLTLQQVYGFEQAKWPEQYKKIINKELSENNINDNNNLEDYCISIYGKKIYETILKGYYEKKYNKPCNILPIDLLEEHNEFNYVMNNSFLHYKYQGIPKHGYTLLIEKIIGDIPIMLNTDYIKNRNKLNAYAKYIIYTGQIDRLMNYCIGPLDWIGMNIEFIEESKNTNNLFGTSVINFVDNSFPYYRSTEHKWFNKNTALLYNKTFITNESYKEWKIGDIPYYCDNNSISNNKYIQYKEYLKKQYTNMYLCGKNAEYKNYSIANTIKSAITLSEMLKEIIDK